MVGSLILVLMIFVCILGVKYLEIDKLKKTIEIQDCEIHRLNKIIYDVANSNQKEKEDKKVSYMADIFRTKKGLLSYKKYIRE